jgi:hypothetical protein
VLENCILCQLTLAQTLESKATIAENNLNTLVLSLKRMEEKNRKVEAENHLLNGTDAALTGLSVQELKNIESKVLGALERIQQAVVSTILAVIHYHSTNTRRRTKKKSAKTRARRAKQRRSAWCSCRAVTRACAKSVLKT